MTWLPRRDVIDFVVCVVEIYLLLVCWPKITLLLYEYINNLVYVWVVQIALISVREIEFDLISV